MITPTNYGGDLSGTFRTDPIEHSLVVGVAYQTRGGNVATAKRTSFAQTSTIPSSPSIRRSRRESFPIRRGPRILASTPKKAIVRAYGDDITGKRYWASTGSSLLAQRLPTIVRLAFSIEL